MSPGATIKDLRRPDGTCQRMTCPKEVSWIARIRMPQIPLEVSPMRLLGFCDGHRSWAEDAFATTVWSLTFEEAEP